MIGRNRLLAVCGRWKLIDRFDAVIALLPEIRRQQVLRALETPADDPGKYVAARRKRELAWLERYGRKAAGASWDCLDRPLQNLFLERKIVNRERT